MIHAAQGVVLALNQNTSLHRGDSLAVNANNTSTNTQGGVDQLVGTINQVKDIVLQYQQLLTDIVANVAFALAVLFVAIGFVRYMTGDPKTGQAQVKNSLVGLAIICFFKVLINGIQQISQAITNQVGNNTDLGESVANFVGQSAMPTIAQFAGTIAVLVIIWGGAQWMSGNVKEGRQTIINGVIGLSGVILSYLIVNIALNIFGLQ